MGPGPSDKVPQLLTEEVHYGGDRLPRKRQWVGVPSKDSLARGGCASGSWTVFFSSLGSPSTGDHRQGVRASEPAAGGTSSGHPLGF